jgi:hypothetical protein
MPEHDVLDISSAASRRRFFIDRVRRRGSRGAGSDLHALLALPGKLHERHDLAMIGQMFGDVPVCLIGAHAVAAYAPERMTQDVDCLTTAGQYEHASELLRQNGYRADGVLSFTTSALGLFGSRWVPEKSGQMIDLISTRQGWADEALREPAQFTTEGDRVIPLAYLVLMKLDAARSVDQGDLSRILGRLADVELDAVAAVVEKYYSHDPGALEDVRQYAEVGRWEYQTPSRTAAEPPQVDRS